MGCFIVPATEAVVTTVVTKVVEKKEKKDGVEFDHANFSSKLKNLNGLLWGGSALLAFEHVWHGEVQPFFPFLTAAESAESLAEMFHEMGTVGVGMAAAVTIVWGVVTGISLYKERHTVEKASNKVKAVSLERSKA